MKPRGGNRSHIPEVLNIQLACPTRNPPHQAPLRHPSHLSQIAQWKGEKKTSEQKGG